MLRKGLVVLLLAAVLVACGVVSPAVASNSQVRQVTIVPLPTTTTVADVPLPTTVPVTELSAKAAGDGAWNAIYAPDPLICRCSNVVPDPSLTLDVDVTAFKIPDGWPEYDWYLISIKTETSVREGRYVQDFPLAGDGRIGWYFQDSQTRIDAAAYADGPLALEDYGPLNSPSAVSESFTIGGGLNLSKEGPGIGIDGSFTRTISHEDVEIANHTIAADKVASWSEDFLCPHGDYTWWFVGDIDYPCADSKGTHRMDYAVIVKVQGGVPNRGAHVSWSHHSTAYIDCIHNCFVLCIDPRCRKTLGVNDQEINVYHNYPPQVESFYPNNTPVAAEVGQRLDFSITWLDLDGTEDSVTWYLDDVEQGSGESWIWNIPSGAGGASGQTHVVRAVVADELDSTAQLWNVQVAAEAWADFSASPTLGQAPLEVAFTDLSANSPNSWAWDFGDGGTSTQQHATHTYADAGIYTVSLTAGGGAGSATKTKEHYILVTFSDVPCEPEEHWAMRAILACMEAGIVQGYPEGTYGPDLLVTRDQMAVYIARAEAWITTDDPIDTAPELFPDVPAGFWAGAAIQACVDNNVVTGYAYPDPDSPGETFYLYAPTATVTRDQMAVFMARSICDPTGDEGLVGYIPADPRNFPDVPNTGYGDGGTDPYWAYRYIEYCVEHGVVNGYEYPDPDTPGETIFLYEPLWPVTRDQMAVYVARAFGLMN